jgi:hypothetical protein
MSSIWDADRWLYDRLTNDATLMNLVTAVYSDIAPEDAVYDFVLMSLPNQGGVSRQTANADRVYDSLRYLIRVVGETESYGALDAAASRIETLLHKASGVTSNGQVLACTYEEPFRMPEVDGSRQFRYLGGYYRLLVQ